MEEAYACGTIYGGNFRTMASLPVEKNFLFAAASNPLPQVDVDMPAQHATTLQSVHLLRPNGMIV